MDELIELERQGWRALSSQGDAGQKFYASVLREDAVMLFPGGMRIDGRENILASLSSQPWESFEIESPRVVSLTHKAVVLVYRVTARRKGSPPYIALISSTYVQDRDWKLVVHQQTPV
jgi:ketosteroid isomerase-like protein